MSTEKAPDWFMKMFDEMGKAYWAERTKNHLNATADALWNQSAATAYNARIAGDSAYANELRDAAEQMATLALQCIRLSHAVVKEVEA